MQRRTLIFGAMAFALPGGGSGGGFAHDFHGKFKDIPPDLQKWVKDLRSRAGTNCCDVSDGDWAEDYEWQSTRQGYRVLHKGKWLEVPEGAVIDGPNKLGRPLVWIRTNPATGEPYVRCFMPGTMG